MSPSSDIFPPDLNSEFELDTGAEPEANHPDIPGHSPLEYTRQQAQAGQEQAEDRRHQEHFYNSALNEVTLGLMKRQDLGQLLKTIVEKAARLVGTRFAYVYLVDPTNSFLELK